MAYRVDRSGRPGGIVLPTDPVLMSLQAIVGLPRDCVTIGQFGRDVAGRAARAVSLDRVAQQYARVTTGIGTDQLWAALRQWGAATLTGREGL